MFKDHPKGLMVLFFTEMWERFSYYGMRGILILYMVASIREGGFGMDDTTAAAVYGLYTALVYLLALPGGWFADRIVGQREAVYYGGVLIAAGNFSLAVPILRDVFFPLGLVLIVIGTGLLKPNVSAIVGDLYPEKDAKRDAGFSIFYMGINIGAFFGPLVCGFLGETVNWHLGFLAAGIFMTLGLIQYKHNLKYFSDAGVLKVESVDEIDKAKKNLNSAVITLVLLALIIYLVHEFGIIEITLQGMAAATGIIIVSLAFLYFLYVLIFGGLDFVEKRRVIVIFFLFIGAALFWSGFEQAGSSMNLFADRYTDRMFFDFEIPASWFQSVGALLIIIFAPLFGALWVKLGTRNPSIPAKFGLGLILLGAGFMMLMWGSGFVSNDGPGVSPGWLISTYFLHTFGELCLSPVGLSSVTKLSPRPLVGQMMGTWFMGAALGNLIAGLVAGQFEKLPLPELFGNVAYLALGAGVVFLLITPFLKKMTGGIK
jgi:POT family proton-dependent oligopeptide transporter